MDRLQPGDDVSGNWPKINRALDLHDANNRRVSELRQRSALKRSGRGNIGEGLFPFKIYLALPHQIPSDVISEDEDTDTGWRTFLIRAGRVEEKTLDGDGCDYYDDDPDSDYFPSGVESTDDQSQQITPIIIPSGAVAYWFWIEITWDQESGDWQPQLRNGENPSDDEDSDNQWETFPKSDGLHIPIGYVDTDTSPGIAIVRQILRADILPGYTVETCDPDTNEPITLHIPGAFKEPNPPDET